MIKNTTNVTNLHGQTFTLKQNLNCKNYGSYAARCLLCGQFYVGHTINKFSKRWAGHRASWRVCSNSESKLTPTADDCSALCAHMIKYHNTLRKATTLPDLFVVILLQQPKNKQNLDLYESQWIYKLDAQINIAKGILPKYI